MINIIKKERIWRRKRSSIITSVFVTRKRERRVWVSCLLFGVFTAHYYYDTNCTVVQYRSNYLLIFATIL
jgi:hypothetical protein